MFGRIKDQDGQFAENEIRIAVLKTENEALRAQIAKLDAEYIVLNTDISDLLRLTRKIDADQQVLLRRPAK